MKRFNSFLKVLALVLVLIGVGFVVVNYYSWIFAQTVEGKIVDVQRVTNPAAFIGGSKITSEQLHSYSILIEDKEGQLYTASSEDRQWQVATKGFCVRALLYRYPPWDLEKAGTFFNARVKELKRCSGEPLPAAPSAEPAPAEELSVPDAAPSGG